MSRPVLKVSASAGGGTPVREAVGKDVEVGMKMGFFSVLKCIEILHRCGDGT